MNRPSRRRWPAALAATGLLAGASACTSDAGVGTGTTAVIETLVVPTTVATTTATTAGPSTTVRTHLVEGLSKGNSGPQVERLQQRLQELGFDPGPVDGVYGDQTRSAVWAFEKLVMQVPRSQVRGRVTDEMWQRMQDPLVVMPRRPDASSRNHTEIYLPEQVVIFFVDDRAALISHMSSGTGQEWCEEVTISPGEYGNETGTEPLKRGECGRSDTPGGIYEYYRRVEGLRQSGLGGMWNPVYFNHGIAIHGALNVPLEPASHGCIRIPMGTSDHFQSLVTDGDQVYVFDGRKDPETYGAQLPPFNWPDPNYVPETTTTTAPPAVPAASTPPPTTTVPG